MIKAVCFDLDDTLYDYRGAMEEWEGYLCAKVSQIVHKPLRTCRMAYSKTKKRLYRERPSDPAVFDFRERISLLLQELGHERDEDLQEELYRDFWTRFLAMILPYPDAITALTRLRRAGKKTAIISNGTRRQQAGKLRALGLWEMFDVKLFSEDVGSNKPNPRIFRCALRKLMVRPREALMVGDICGIDIRGAKEIGMVTCWVRRGAYASRLPQGTSEEPDFVVGDLNQLERILEQL